MYLDARVLPAEALLEGFQHLFQDIYTYGCLFLTLYMKDFRPKLTSTFTITIFESTLKVLKVTHNLKGTLIITKRNVGQFYSNLQA